MLGLTEPPPGADRYYSADLIRRTAEDILAGRLAMFPGKSHSYAIGSKAAVHVALGYLLAGRAPVEPPSVRDA